MIGKPVGSLWEAFPKLPVRNCILFKCVAYVLGSLGSLPRKSCSREFEFSGDRYNSFAPQKREFAGAQPPAELPRLPIGFSKPLKDIDREWKAMGSLPEASQVPRHPRHP